MAYCASSDIHVDGVNSRTYRYVVSTVGYSGTQCQNNMQLNIVNSDIQVSRAKYDMQVDIANNNIQLINSSRQNQYR